MSDDNPVIPESQPEQPAQPVQPPAPATPPVTAPAPQPAPAPAVAPQVPAPAAAPAAPAAAPAGPAPELGADQLAAEKKAAIVDAKKQAIRAKGAKKRLILKLVGAFFFVMLLVFAVTFVMLGSNTGGGSNPLLQLFGLSEEQLYPFLINMVNILFGLANFIAFIFGGIGLAKVAMSKKDEKIKKKKGLITMSIGMGLFIVISIVWAGSYFYLQDLKAQYLRTTQGEVQYVLTDPVDTNNLSAPATIEFDATELPVDARKFTIISYAWDFGDESTATGSKVSHRYTAKGEEDGRYIVELTVAYRDKATSEEAEEIFTVDVVFANEKVNAAFSADPSTGSIPLVVQFDASESIDPDGEISEYEWDLDGDGKYDDGDEEQVEYTYDKFGTYTVKLRVTDNNGESDVEEMDIVVDEGQLPTAEIDVDLEDEGTAFANETYIFKANNASSPNGSVTKYEWDFGDGTTTTKNKTAQHEFVKAGTYTITLTLIDEDDEKGTVTMEVEVEDEASAPVPVILWRMLKV
jgi:PKD repeat protein